MQLPTPHIYALTLKARATYEVTLRGSDRSGFQKPATSKCPKMYVVTEARDIHYVGVTKRQMSARINFGLKAKGKGGYHGYKWKGIRRPLALYVWSFSDERGKPPMRELETIEAEFAFLVRSETERWPLSQTEIHFYPATEAHLTAAKGMLKFIRDDTIA